MKRHSAHFAARSAFLGEPERFVMIMVIFGAGASYDSVPSRSPKIGIYRRDFLPNRPPLASELFLDLGFFTDSLGRFPQCKPIVPYLRSIAPGETFEHVMETLQAEGETDPERQRQMAAIRFYLHYGIWECERLWEDSTALGITNYVTLLEAALWPSFLRRPVCLLFGRVPGCRWALNRTGNRTG